MIVTLLLLAAKSLLVAAVTLALLRVTRARSAAERSTVAHLGLFALVALPLASLALPTLALPIPASVARFAATAPAAAPQPALPVASQTTAAADNNGSRTAAARPPAAGALTTIIVGAARYAFLLPTMLLLALTLVALLRLVGLRRRADVLVDPDWLSALARAQRRMGFKNGTALLWSDELGSPVSWGLMRPVILLNNAAVAAPEQAEAIIAHELAHVVHLDWAKLILARVATAAFWFNPLAWVLAREAHQLREEAADDAVLAANIAGPDYAELLIGVARHQCRGALLGAHGVAPSKSSLGRRVRRVLDQSPARGPSGRSWVAGFATGMLSMAVPLAAVTIVPGRTALATVPTAGDVHEGAARTAKRLAATISPKPTAGSKDPATDGATAVAATSSSPSSPGQDAGSRSTDENPAIAIDVPGVRVRLDGIPTTAVSDQYRRSMAQAGFANLSDDQLAEARGGGVSPDYARAMRATGMRLGIEDIVEARNMGLNPAYIAAMRQFGIKGELDDYQGMRAVGVSIEFVKKLRRRGINTTSPDKLTELAAAGADPQPDPDP
ncbi:MAG: M56 family metallopeptidase [Sphingomonas sp.]|uniref:M56 family metallopeptidase n=1 Tax=Sphingomonas sp. TaxID=28214 RepID=UPI003F7DD551